MQRSKRRKMSNKRKFRRRRQTAGFVMFGCLAIILLSGMVFFNSAPERETAEIKVQRLKTPDVAVAPGAVDEAKVEEVAPAPAEEEADEADPAGDEAKDESAAAESEDSEGGSGDGGKEKKEESSGGSEIPEPATNDLYLTVPKMGLTDNYVTNSDDPIAMDNGAIKLPSTGFPWQNNANTYIAAHVLGYAGTGSYMQFAGLPSMTYGDVIYLTDANGTVYTYEVYEILTVYPPDNWVTDPIPGKDMISLQTCVNPPAYDQRLVVRAERVDVEVAT